MSLHVGDLVVVARDITRSEAGDTVLILYAKKGEQGTIEEIFRPTPTGMFEIKAHSAKVRMTTGRLKTFRLTSLQRINL